MTFIVIFHILVVLSFSIRILLRDDLSPPARLAWFIVLNVLPYVGAVLYFFVWRNWSGQQGTTAA